MKRVTVPSEGNRKISGMIGGAFLWAHILKAHSIRAPGIEGRVMQVEEFRRNGRSAFDETGTNDKEESTTRRL